MVRVRLLVTGFASHETWARGVQRACGGGERRHPPPAHRVTLEVQPGDRWKFRMLVAATQCRGLCHDDDEDDDIIVVDSMLDITPLAAMLRSGHETTTTSPRRRRRRPTKLLVYMHENQLTTPLWNVDDRDVRNRTHWTFGMVHLRSLYAADGLVFNSTTHRHSFQDAVLRLIKEQCPRDEMETYLDQARELMSQKCCVLHYGLELDDLVARWPNGETTGTAEDGTGEPPIVLWNARLEADKDPDAFLRILHGVRETGTPFRLVVLGTDPSRGQTWYERFRHEFPHETVHVGWCADRSEYASWLRQSDVIVSTARHETFGISLVESVYCGVVPLLPYRLSYPELFPPEEFPDCFYRSPDEAVTKLVRLLRMRRSDAWDGLRSRAHDAIAMYRWQIMGPVYDEFFAQVAAGVPIGDVPTTVPDRSTVVERSAVEPVMSSLDDDDDDDTTTKRDDIDSGFTVITQAHDARVQLYRPKSVRDHREYHRQVALCKETSGMEPVLHGGRRATVRMLEAIALGSHSIRPISFLTTRELAEKVFLESAQQSVQRSLPENVPLYVAEKDLLDEIRGQKLNAGDAVLAVAQFPVACQLSDVLANPPIVILEDVRNAENVGSILRTAFCLGITSVVASPTSWAALKDGRAARCSMGTMYYHRYFRTGAILAETIQRIRDSGTSVYGVEIGPDAIPVRPHGADRNWAMVLGNEDVGLQTETRQACDGLVFVPQAHGDSLNVGHAAAITMFELGRQGEPPSHDGKAACA